MDASLNYLLHLADDALVLGQRNAEWCGHGPVIEEDIAMANISLDLIGQARLLYQLVAQRMGQGTTEDSLAYFRDAHEFRNHTLLELPHAGPQVGHALSERDYATTLVRHFLYSAFSLLRWDSLCNSQDADLAAIAAKSVKELRYHLRHARGWLVRLGDGTEISHARMQAALDHLMPFTQEFWTASADEQAALASGLIPCVAADWQSDWDQLVDDALLESTLQRPSAIGHVSQGKSCVHSEHLSYLLADMQSLARAHPGATW
ncbi:MAG: phenylacetate-CoA oxygenase subunit PaaI [Betaproteobacteria bacterium]|jgi:ring-1,2-phenylacetyl-CoA epoxidase subunit PaaC|nr:phenylacetate-CoA oxygenase subunit PaaI [Betaproteobacteria bacterium]